MTQHTLRVNNSLTRLLDSIGHVFYSIYEALQIAQTKRAFYLVHERMMMYKEYRQTYSELHKLTDRELADIGIDRGMIHSIAMDAYYAKHNN